MNYYEYGTEYKTNIDKSLQKLSSSVDLNKSEELYYRTDNTRYEELIFSENELRKL